MRLEHLPTLLPTRLPYPGAQPIAGQYAASFAPGANTDHSFWAPVFHPRASFTLDVQDVGRGADYLSRVAATIFPPLAHDPSARPARVIFWGASLLGEGCQNPSTPFDFLRAMYVPAVHIDFLDQHDTRWMPVNTNLLSFPLPAISSASIQLIGGVCLGIDVDAVAELAIHPACLADDGLLRIVCAHAPTARYLAEENRALNATVVPVTYGAQTLAYLVAGYKRSPPRQYVGPETKALQTTLAEAMASSLYVDPMHTVAEKHVDAGRLLGAYVARCAEQGENSGIKGFVRFLDDTDDSAARVVRYILLARCTRNVRPLRDTGAAISPIALRYAAKNPIRHVLETLTFYATATPVTTIPLRKLRPVHLVVGADRKLDINRLDFFRRAIIGMLRHLDAREQPTDAALRVALSGGLGEESLPMRSDYSRMAHGHFLLNGTHRIAALISLVADEYLPATVLDGIPVLNPDLSADLLLAEAFGRDRPMVLQWSDVLAFHPGSVRLLRNYEA